MKSSESIAGEPTPPEGRGETSAVQRQEFCALATARRVAAMLDLEPSLASGAALPRGWQFVLLAADTRRSQLRSDGYPGLGVPMPDLGLPRLMLGGRTVDFHADIPIDAPVLRSSAVRNIAHKSTATGPMAVVTLSHELVVSGQSKPALVETQTYLLLPARSPDALASGSGSALPQVPVQAQHMKTVVPDETLLFQYSALGFNSHRIHLDRDHARHVEGFADRVVNGGLSTLLLTEFLRLDLGVTPARIVVRHVAPLLCGHTLTLTADRVGPDWNLKAYDDLNHLAVDMGVTAR